MASEQEAQGPSLERLIEQVPAIAWTTDGELRITSWRGGGRRVRGAPPEAEVGMTVEDYVRGTAEAPEVIAHRRALAGEVATTEARWADRIYQIHIEPICDPDGRVSGVMGIAWDVTEQRRIDLERQRLQSQLRQHHKLEAVGNLASGVAHEINNPVQSIMNFAQLIRARAETEAVRDYADEIMNETQRVASIVRNLQAFARQDEELPSELDLAQVVERTVSLFRSVMRKENIEVTVDVPSDLPSVWFRGQGLQQVIVNLLTCARDALNDRYPKANENKRVSIRAGTESIRGDEVVRLVVEDRGTAIAESDLSLVFEEFKSLPGRDQGSGLSLSICHSIVQENDGVIVVESAPEGYTRVVVDLPLAAD